MRQHLLIDADDTLWENNIYFEQAFEEFVNYLGHSSLSALQIRDILDEIELERIESHGYGAVNFAHNCYQCYEKLVEREIRPEDAKRLHALGERIMSQPIELLDGVLETLEYLAGRHDLTLFTKGHPREQQLKIERSGIAIYFDHTAIVREKNASAYATIVRERSMDPGRTWMIGNSPKSDINPALEAGLHAVFVPHDRTWHLEKTSLREGPGKLLRLNKFADLQSHF